MAHATMHSPPTKGSVIHWARWYDPLVQLMTRGRAGRMRQLMAARVGAQPGEHLLDVGCGTGALTLLLAQAVGKQGTVVGIDASPEMIQLAQRKAAKKDLSVTYHVESVEALTSPSQSFDRAISTLVFHHLPMSLKQQSLMELARVLKPGGWLTLIDFSMGIHQPEQPAALTERLTALGFTSISETPFEFGGLICLTARKQPASAV